MRPTRITALALALTMTAPLISCADNSESLSGDDSSASKTTSAKETSTDSSGSTYSGEYRIAYEPFDLDELREHPLALLEDIKKPGNRDKVSEDIELLLSDWRLVQDASSRITLNYYLDFENEELEAENDRCSEDAYVYSLLTALALTRCYEKDEYSDLAEDYIDDNMLEIFESPSMTAKRVEGYARVDYELSDELLDEYYDLYSDEDIDEDEKALRCAEIYLNVLRGNESNIEDIYRDYCRDFDTETVADMTDEVIDSILPAYMDLYDAFSEMDGADDILYDPPEIDEPFTIIQKYAPRLNNDIARLADKIIDEELYCFTGDEAAYPGSFTTSLPLTDDAFIFINHMDDMYAMSTAVHEFGHFCSAYNYDGGRYNTPMCLDIAEIQSQGFEFLFTQFYDDIYGDLAEPMKAYRVLDMLDSAIGGFMVGKFENEVITRLDELEPEDVITIWNDVCGDVFSINFYDIPHVFESPGYYLSYGTSALAAFDIWRDCSKSLSKAQEKYEKISKVDVYSYDTQFCKSLKSCGFSDVMSVKYVRSLADEIEEYADSLS